MQPSPGSDMSTESSGLSAEQLAHFNAFGYLVLKQCFSADELATIQREFGYKMDQQYGDTYDGTRRYWTRLLDEDTPFYASLLEDPRFLTVAQQMYGDDVLGMNTDANRYTGDTGWHRDTTTVSQYGVKFAFYHQHVDADSGALRVIPSTHLLPDDAGFDQDVRGMQGENVPCAVLASEPGDVVAFDLRLWHAAFGGSTDRHMSTIVYYANPGTPEEESALTAQAANNVAYIRENFSPRQDCFFTKDWLANPKRSPVRQAWIDRLDELHYFDAPGVVES